MEENNHIYPIFDKMLMRKDKEDLLKQHGVMVWFTGLSGSGKSTIAIALATFISGYGFIQYILGTILFALSLLFSIRKLNLTWNQIKQTFARRMQRK